MKTYSVLSVEDLHTIVDTLSKSKNLKAKKIGERMKKELDYPEIPCEMEIIGANGEELFDRD